MIIFNLSLLKTAIKKVLFLWKKKAPWDESLRLGCCPTQDKYTIYIYIYILHTGTGVVSAVLSGAYDSSVSSQFWCSVTDALVFYSGLYFQKKSALPAETSALHLAFESVLFIVGLSLSLCFQPVPELARSSDYGEEYGIICLNPYWTFSPEHSLFTLYSKDYPTVSYRGHIWGLNLLLQPMETEHNNCSPSLAFRTHCLLHPHGQDCLCVCCRLQYALFTGRSGLKNDTSLKGWVYTCS